ncbi:MAG: hypothetical protein OHK93_007464 [Ramalina farinacea]|uniref:endo-1,3(4)-beta-glucanase n=1 Tax=Ramalina farinacea TaxID=258253 RepID=A0AA43TVJ2_9LECA|nr:hypothetical protein [Ramalina farinacea]
MHYSTLLLGAAGLAPLTFAGYTIQDDYSAANFFNMFTFDTEDDPTHGYVNYIDQSTAQSSNLISTSNNQITIKSDSTTTPTTGRGRNSVRITSKTQYTHGLVVLDLEHMPASACGIWPAFWMTGPNWPNSGEIDIIEGVNYQAQNAMTMHTSAGCTLIQKDCQGNQGCGVQTGGSGSYGDGFNNGQGGVYAMEWTSGSIDIWFLPRGDGRITNALSDSPDPTQWGAAMAAFQGGQGCTIDDHFMNNNIVFDTTFCGDWAGSVWSSDATCSSKAATCQDYVSAHPEAYTNAYWTINSLKVYSSSGSTAQSAIAKPAAAQQQNAEKQQQSTSASAPLSTVSSPATSTPVAASSSSSAPTTTSAAPRKSTTMSVTPNADGTLAESPDEAAYNVGSADGGKRWSENSSAKRSDEDDAPLSARSSSLRELGNGTAAVVVTPRLVVEGDEVSVKRGVIGLMMENEGERSSRVKRHLRHVKRRAGRGHHLA